MLTQKQIHTFARVYQVTSKCPDEIMNNSGKKCIIRGFRNIGQNCWVPIIEFHDTMRMWVLPREIAE